MIVSDEMLETIITRARAAAPGPWMPGRGGEIVAPPSDGHPHTEHYSGHLVAESVAPGNAHHIAGLSPEVVIAIAMELLQRRQSVAAGSDG